ncbi:MAG: hypothetical protein AMS23_06010 [Bacteroides sp. SM1_62]|nr:MAG: hypothetical protein AMS23_06010 [Bacteroides sp. SM1_62]
MNTQFIKNSLVKEIARLTKIGLSVVLFLGFIGLADAKEGEKVKEVVVETKELVGEVVSFTPRKEPQFIGIAVEEENADYIFIIDKETKVVHKKQLSEIAIGDMVKIKYYVVVETEEGGKQRTKHIAREVTFVKSGSGSEK